ncbi:MAG TPA: hypothetical protein VN328_06805 [Thermodesulfovibrionales bacterium]|nr:hypothetical protein [Thermodesulfovibrionales bacterium]
MSRKLLFTPIEFTKDPHEGGEVLKGIAVNLCEGGMRVYAYCPLSEGDRISVLSPLPTPHKRFIVQWIEQLLDGFFVLGLIFEL